MAKRKAAEYHEKTDITEFIGNPLIAALPESLPQEALIKELFKRPPYEEEERNSFPQSRLEMLSRIGMLHIPYTHDMFIARNLSRCINWGYVSRNPMPFETTAQVLATYKGEVSPELENYLTATLFPTYGFSVLGISGVGKSSSVMNALMRYPQVIDHTQYQGIPFTCSQIVWLKVDCPGDGTPKGLCTAIIQQMDAVLGTNYRSEVTSRISKDMLTTKVSQSLRTHHLGVLVIDDIQNLCDAKKDASSDMMSFLIYLMETLAIPVVMVGTPKVLSLFQQEFQLAKRATGDGTVRMDLLRRDTKEWERFIKIIWSYQFTASRVPLSPELEKVFYEESVGNPFLCAILYKLVQDDAITSREETFTVQDVKKVAREKLCITSGMRANMLSGQDEELRKYEYLWGVASMPAENYEEALRPKVTKPSKEQENLEWISQELVKRLGIDVSLATKLAKEAVAAKGGVDREEALGFAIILCEKSLAQKGPGKQNGQESDPQ